MRISDWSSDVCSSDLIDPDTRPGQRAVHRRQLEGGHLLGAECDRRFGVQLAADAEPVGEVDDGLGPDLGQRLRVHGVQDRKRVGEGKSEYVRVDLGGRRIRKKKKKTII